MRFQNTLLSEHHVLQNVGIHQKGEENILINALKVTLQQDFDYRTVGRHTCSWDAVSPHC